MELLRDAEPIVEASALVFEEAGLGYVADSLRRELPLEGLDQAFGVASIFQEVLEIGDVDPDVSWVATNLAFFAMGAVFAAADGDIDLFNDCLTMVQRLVDGEAGKRSVH